MAPPPALRSIFPASLDSLPKRPAGRFGAPSGLTRRLPLLICLVLALVPGLLASPAAHAFQAEPTGWETLSWGAGLPEIFAKRPTLARRGYRLPTAQAAYARHAGGIVLDDQASFLDFADAPVRLSVGPTGLFRVDWTLEDPDPAHYARGKELVRALVERHGAPTAEQGKRRVWKGETTVIVLEEQPAIAGVRFNLALVRTSDFTD